MHATSDHVGQARLLERSAENQDALVTAWIIRDSVLLALSILLALSASLAWFVFRQWHDDVFGKLRPCFVDAAHRVGAAVLEIAFAKLTAKRIPARGKSIDNDLSADPEQVFIHTPPDQLGLRLHVADIDNGLAGVVDRFNVEKTVRVNKVELLDCPFDADQAVLEKMRPETVVSACYWRQDERTQG